MGDHTGIGGCCSFFLFFAIFLSYFFIFLPSPDTWTSNFRHFLEVACFGSWGRLFEVVLVADQHDRRSFRIPFGIGGRRSCFCTVKISGLPSSDLRTEMNNRPCLPWTGAKGKILSAKISSRQHLSYAWGNFNSCNYVFSRITFT